jgi:hypothetical protein
MHSKLYIAVVAMLAALVDQEGWGNVGMIIIHLCFGYEELRHAPNSCDFRITLWWSRGERVWCMGSDLRPTQRGVWGKIYRFGDAAFAYPRLFPG